MKFNRKIAGSICFGLSAVAGLMLCSSFYFAPKSTDAVGDQSAVEVGSVSDDEMLLQSAKAQRMVEFRDTSVTLYAGVTEQIRDSRIAASKEASAKRAENAVPTTQASASAEEQEDVSFVEEEFVENGSNERGSVVSQGFVADGNPYESVVVIEGTVAEKYEDDRGDTWVLDSGVALLDSAVVDESYVSEPLSLSASSRELFERLVQGEARGEGFAGAAIVAQSLRDNMRDKEIYDTATIKRVMKYSGSTSEEPSECVKKACAFILDEGGMALQHRILYFYSPKNMKNHWSSFHESQTFLIEYKGHRVFDRKS